MRNNQKRNKQRPKITDAELVRDGERGALIVRKPYLIQKNKAEKDLIKSLKSDHKKIVGTSKHQNGRAEMLEVIRNSRVPNMNISFSSLY